MRFTSFRVMVIPWLPQVYHLFPFRSVQSSSFSVLLLPLFFFFFFLYELAEDGWILDLAHFESARD